MQEIKYLANTLKTNSDFESIYKNMLKDFEKLGRLAPIKKDIEENTFIPGEKLYTFNTQVKFKDNMFNLCLQRRYCNKTFIDDCFEQTRNQSIQVYINTNQIDFDKLYDFKLKVKSILSKYFKEIYVLLDTQNENLRVQLCFDINQIENTMRKLINSYMVKKVGVYWFEENLSEKYQNKSEVCSTWYNSKYNDFKEVKSDVFNLQIQDLIQMLKNSKYFSLESVWDSEVKNLLPNDFEEQLNDFIKLKNAVAYNKPICRNLKKDVDISIKKLHLILSEFNNNINFK